ncbi:MAG TPA: carbon-nitrogen hydrolase family protein [Symbiobacteriaceae bacterium]|nr:carbon-nitrogen hydrolase family protein [Symbiobacteriaceae bacterium]
MFRVALLQMVSCGADVEASLRKGDRFCREAAAAGADLALFPELWSHGYTYAKVHTCDFADEAALTPGDEFLVCTVDTAEDGPVAVGAMICFDREFPESAWVLMLKGAEIILTPNACGLEEHRLAQFRTRAFENMLGVAMCNYAAPQNNGHSIAFDGMAFNADETSRDMKLVAAGENEEIYMATFDMKQIRAYREREAMGDAYRKPRAYQGLTERAALRPFIRPDARR